MNLRIDLLPYEDKNQKTFYVGKLRGPFTIDCAAGVAFLIFISESGDEELQIAPLDDKTHYWNQFEQKPDRLSILLDSSKDREGRIFYVGKLQTQGKINCINGASFIVFVSKKGKEELQIIAPFSTTAVDIIRSRPFPSD